MAKNFACLDCDSPVGKRNARCRPCRWKAWYAENAVDVKERARIHRMSAPEAAAEAAWVASLMRKYGITLEQYTQMLVKQGGMCAICKGLDITGKRLAVDHCHVTGKVRGLLCGRCNMRLGEIEKLGLLQPMMEYLEEAA